MCCGLAANRACLRSKGPDVFIVDQQQLDQLETAMDAEFARRGVAFFRRTLPNRVAASNDDELNAIIMVGLNRCRSYGICKTPAILQFVAIMLLVSPEFDAVPDVARFLRAPGVDPNLKVEVLTQLLARHLQDGS